MDGNEHSKEGESELSKLPYDDDDVDDDNGGDGINGNYDDNNDNDDCDHHIHTGIESDEDGDDDGTMMISFRTVLLPLSLNFSLNSLQQVSFCLSQLSYLSTHSLNFNFLVYFYTSSYPFSVLCSFHSAK